jgi:ribosomal protein RSM22 (predicted rRNA methylase)
VTNGFILRRIQGAGAKNATTKKEKRMNDEYLQAKFNLCINQAERDLQEQDIANAIKNLQRANSAMSRLFGIEEGESE